MGLGYLAAHYAFRITNFPMHSLCMQYSQFSDAFGNTITVLEALYEYPVHHGMVLHKSN